VSADLDALDRGVIEVGQVAAVSMGNLGQFYVPPAWPG
jgi:hypothetical protein